MSVNRRVRMRAWACPLLMLATLAAVSCQSDDASSGGNVCPACDPQVGGETGDFGGTPTICEGFRKAVAVDRAAAIALGFDVEELERRVARPIDMPLRWKASETLGGGPATGFDADTRIVASVKSTGVFHHVRVDPALCNGATCTRGEHVLMRETCGDRLELGVRAELRTLDGALEAATDGVATLRRDGALNSGPPTFAHPFFVTRASLSSVTGSLRLFPEPGAFEYRTRLVFEASLLADTCEGSASPSVLVKDSAFTGTDYHPLTGYFPPSKAGGAVSTDAGRLRSDAGEALLDTGAPIAVTDAGAKR